MASFLSDRIVDEILESLSRSQHTLVGVLSACLSFFHLVFLCTHASPVHLQADHLIRKSQPLLRQEPHSETEVLDESVLQPEEHKQEQRKDEGGRKEEREDMDSCMVGQD